MSRSNNCDYLFSYGIYFPTRTIWMTGDITEDKYDKWSKAIYILSRSKGDISIHLNSEGGCVTQCRAIYTCIKQCINNHVKIVVYGQAASSASIILQAGDTRVMTLDSDLMIHLGEETLATDHPRNIDRAHAYNRRVEKWMKDVYLSKIKEKRPRFTKTKLEELIQFDRFINAKQALTLGLVDSVGDLT